MLLRRKRWTVPICFTITCLLFAYFVIPLRFAGSFHVLDFPPTLSLGKLQPQNSKSVVFVLGMHHSMTSVATKLLLDTGYFYGGRLSDLLLRADNPLKYWELRNCVHANQRYFNHKQPASNSRRQGLYSWIGHGVSYSDDDLAALELKKEAKAQLIRLSDLNKEGRPLLIKDPRLSLALPAWIQAAKETDLSVRCVLLVRDPMESAYRFLADYRVLSAPEWANVWEVYTSEAIESCRNVPIELVRHEDYALDPWKTTLALLARLVHLPPISSSSPPLRLKKDFPKDWAPKHAKKMETWNSGKAYLPLQLPELLSPRGVQLWTSLSSSQRTAIGRIPWRSLPFTRTDGVIFTRFQRSIGLENYRVLIRSIFVHDTTRPVVVGFTHEDEYSRFQDEFHSWGFRSCVATACETTPDQVEVPGNDLAIAHHSNGVFEFESCDKGQCAHADMFRALSQLGGRVSEMVI